MVSFRIFLERDEILPLYREYVADAIEGEDLEDGKLVFVVSQLDGNIDDVFDDPDELDSYMKEMGVRGQCVWELPHGSMGDCKLMAIFPKAFARPRFGLHSAETPIEAGEVPSKDPFGRNFRGTPREIIFYGMNTPHIQKYTKVLRLRQLDDDTWIGRHRPVNVKVWEKKPE